MSSWLIIAVNKYPETKLHRKKVGFELDCMKMKINMRFFDFGQK